VAISGSGSGQPAMVGQLGEFPLIKALIARLPTTAEVILGPGDDAAVVRAPDRQVVASTDLLVDGVHFRRDWSSAEDVGHKAAAQNLADIEAMGARPTALLVGLAAPPDLPTAWVLALADGLAAEASLVGAAVVGGDVVASERLVVSVTALGTTEGRAPVTRGGAQPGDVVAVTGRLGWSAAGLAVLSRGFRSPRILVEAHRRPHPPYGEGARAAGHGASAMIDVSDGLVADLAHVAEASGVRVDLSTSALVVADPLRDAAAALGRDPLEWVLTGGEDHALAATFPPMPGAPSGWTVVGQVHEGEGVRVDGAAYEGPGGWRHFDR